MLVIRTLPCKTLRKTCNGLSAAGRCVECERLLEVSFFKPTAGISDPNVRRASKTPRAVGNHWLKFCLIVMKLTSAASRVTADNRKVACVSQGRET